MSQRQRDIIAALITEAEGAATRCRYRAKTQRGETIEQLYTDEAEYFQERCDTLRLLLALATIEPQE